MITKIIIEINFTSQYVYNFFQKPVAISDMSMNQVWSGSLKKNKWKLGSCVLTPFDITTTGTFIAMFQPIYKGCLSNTSNTGSDNFKLCVKTLGF